MISDLLQAWMAKEMRSTIAKICVSAAGHDFERELETGAKATSVAAL